MKDMFLSRLAFQMETMIAYKKALGYSENTYRPHCKNLDRYCMNHFPQEDRLTKEVVLGWMERRPGEAPATLHGRAGFIRGFGRYLVSAGEEAYILPDKFVGGKSTFIPYIFTDEELAALFHEIDGEENSRDSLKPFLLSTVFRLIYTCGLRPNEGRCLKRDNVNLKTGEILITETKRHKERIVVMSDDMLALAKPYAFIRDAAYPESEWFFPTPRGDVYSAAWLQKKFKGFFMAANSGIEPALLPAVRVYDLRHRFASAALNRWLDDKKDLYSRLPYLRTYMGHTQLSATVYYIHLLPENLVKSAGIDWDSMRGMLPEVELWED